MSTELTPALKSLDARQAVLNAKMADLLRKGYRVTRQTDTTAQLVKPKRFSFGFALLWFLAAGVGLIVYLLYYAGKKDKVVYLEVAEDGRLRISVNGHAGYWAPTSGGG